MRRKLRDRRVLERFEIRKLILAPFVRGTFCDYRFRLSNGRSFLRHRKNNSHRPSMAVVIELPNGGRKFHSRRSCCPKPQGPISISVFSRLCFDLTHKAADAAACETDLAGWPRNDNCSPFSRSHQSAVSKQCYFRQKVWHEYTRPIIHDQLSTRDSYL